MGVTVQNFKQEYMQFHLDYTLLQFISNILANIHVAILQSRTFPFRLTSRKRLWCESEPVDINSQWRESCKSASVVNAQLVDNPTIRQPGFALPRQQWSLLNRF